MNDNNKLGLLYFILFLVFTWSSPVLGQNSGGLNASKQAKEFYDALPLTKITNKSILGDFSLRNYAPMPFNQGKIPMCVPTSIMYSAGTIMTAQHFNWHRDSLSAPLINKNALSGKFGYAGVIDKKGYRCLSSLMFNEVFDFYASTGISKDSEFDLIKESTTNPCYKKNNDYQSALSIKLKGIPKSLFKRDENYEIIEGKFSNIETILAEKRPVVVGLKLFTDYTKQIKDFILTPNNDKETELLHAVTIIGIKEIDSKDYYEIMDSRGTAIGDAGFWWISAKELEERLIFGFDFQLDFPKSKSLDTYLEFTLPKDNSTLKIDGTYNEKNKTFVVQKSSWKEKINFRTHVSDLHKGNFVYMLYYSPSEQMHYDYFENGNSRKKKIIFEEQDIYFPEKKEKKDGFSKTDTDYMLFLYTYEAIDIESVLQNLNKCESNSSIYDCLTTVLEDELITEVTYKYNPTTHQVSCHISDTPTSSISGTIIPLIIKFEE